MRLRVLAVLGLLSAAGAEAVLVPIKLDEFKRRAPCAIRVRVEEVTQVTIDPQDLDELDLKASMRVLEAFGNCESFSDTVEVRYSLEVHSSQPVQGEEALVFPTKKGTWLTEAVYGRSHWPIQSIDGEPFVSVSWRNSFLFAWNVLWPGEHAFVALSSIRRMWTDARRNASNRN